MMEESQFMVSFKCVCIKVSKTPDSSSKQLKKYTHLRYSPQLLSFHKEIWPSSSVSGFVTGKLFFGSVILRSR